MASHSATRLAVIGFGNIGQAVVAGALQSRVLVASELVVIESDRTKRAEASALGCVTGDDCALAAEAQQVLLAVKPQSFPEIARGLGGRQQRTVFISVMAGISGTKILAAIADTRAHATVRAMPNTPCRVGLGMTGLALGAGARDGDDELAARLFGAVGRTVRVEERMLDAITATSGSGPAYLFLLAEAWEDASVALGFDRTTARDLVRQTIAGAAKMLEDRAIDAKDLRASVTSKGGTTAAAIQVMEQRELRAVMRDALAAAAERGRELGA